MTRKKRRLYLLGLAALGVGAAAALTLTAFQDNLLFFYSPTDIVERGGPPTERFRLGGLVAEDSVERLEDGVTVSFTVTDTAHEVPVTYTGLLPDLFREGQGVVAEGRIGGDGVFVADQVLAKHDETYMPPGVAEALESADRFRDRAAGSLAPAAVGPGS